MTTYKITVKGRVQGVGYRYFIKRKAESLDIKGYVRNDKSGDVQILAEGEKDVLEELMDYCRVGPSSSIVKSVNYQKVPFVGFIFFEIQI